MKQCTLAIIGLGYVGLPLAVEFGKTRNVIGFDISQKRVDQLLEGIDITGETTAREINDAKGLKISCNKEDLKEADIFIITVPTPIDCANQPDLRPLISASNLVGSYIKRGSIVIYESTVYPGCTEEVCVKILEEVSGLVYNVDFFCGYSPERINPGDKVNTLTKIKKITSGSNDIAAAAVDELYASIIEAGTYKAKSIMVAEAAKVIENTQRDLNIALVNELSVIFERIGLDTSDVLDAACTKWNFLNFRPGLVGGHCIGVDPYYLTYKAEMIGYHPQVIQSGRRLNDNMGRYAARNIIRMMLVNNINAASAKVGVFGITFKENCPDLRNSKSVDVINELKKWNVNVSVCDPWADKQEAKDHYGLELVEYEQMNDLDAIIVTVAHDKFKSMDVNNLKSMCKSNIPVIGDLKSIFCKSKLQDAGFSVFRL